MPGLFIISLLSLQNGTDRMECLSSSYVLLLLYSFIVMWWGCRVIKLTLREAADTEDEAQQNLKGKEQKRQRLEY